MSTPGTDEVVITALEALSPVGHSAVATCAALRARISRFQEHPSYLPHLRELFASSPEKARVAYVPPFQVRNTRGQRLMELALPPMKALMAGAGLTRKDLETTRFLFSLPAPRDGRDAPGAGQDFVRAYLERLALPDTVPCHLHQEGQTGMFTALAEAMDCLRREACRYCVLVGVESYLDTDTLRGLDDAWRLKSERNVDGFIPGECATVLLLETRRNARARERQVLGRIRGLATGTEPQPIGGERLSTGRGLTKAIRGALAASAEPEGFWTLCDLNGESYRAHEWGLALARLGPLLEPQRALWHPGDCIGDVGAASGGLYLTMACRAFSRGYAPAKRALLWSSADNGGRAACVVDHPT